MNEGVYWNADKSSKNWIPYRQTEDRVFIRSSEPAMREAEYLRLKGKLEDASYMWEYVYENNSKNRLKVYSSYNLAVYYESLMDYETALSWIDKCINLNQKEMVIGDINILEYRDFLQKRNKEFPKLKSQIPFLFED